MYCYNVFIVDFEHFLLAGMKLPEIYPTRKKSLSEATASTTDSNL